MSRSRIFGILLIAVGLAALVMSALSLRTHDPKQTRQAKRLPAAKAELDSTRAEIKHTSLLYQGFKANTSSIPDTTRMYAGGLIMDQGRMYQKKIHLLEVRERDLVLEVTQGEKHVAAAISAARARALPRAAGGLVALLAGVVLCVRPRKRDAS